MNSLQNNLVPLVPLVQGTNGTNGTNEHRYSLENIIVVIILHYEVNTYLCSKYTTV